MTFLHEDEGFVINNDNKEYCQEVINLNNKLFKLKLIEKYITIDDLKNTDLFTHNEVKIIVKIVSHLQEMDLSDELPDIFYSRGYSDGSNDPVVAKSFQKIFLAK